jgi:hypothetical protein
MTPSKKEVGHIQCIEKHRKVLEELNWGPIPIPITTTPLRNNVNDAMERGLENEQEQSSCQRMLSLDLEN